MGWIRRLLGRERAPGREAVDREPQPVLLDVTTRPVERGHRIPPPPLPRIPTPAPAPVAVARARQVDVRSPTMRWVPAGQSVKVGRHTIPDGMIYFGPAAAGSSGYPSASSPPCLVDPDLKVASAAPPTPPALDYWPSYAAMTPQTRATYLDWLVAGRRDPAVPVGYAFVYFYGLERRLLLDQPQPDERAVLVAEVERLRCVYGPVSGSFEGHASTLLREVHGREMISRSGWASGWVPDPEGDCRRIEIPLRLEVGRAVADGEALPFELAMAMVLAMPPHLGGVGDRRMALRVRPALVALARIRFAAAFPKGLKLRDKRGSTLSIAYRGAASQLGVPPVAPARRVPDPFDLTWTRMTDLCVQAVADLLPYARAAGENGSDAGTPKALAAMPRELRDAGFGGAAGLGAWLSTLPPVSSIGADELWARCNGSGTPKLKDLKAASAILEASGWGLEPDPLTGRTAERFGIFRVPPGADVRSAAVGLAVGRLCTSLVLTLIDAGPRRDTAVERVAADLGLPPIGNLRLAAHLASLDGAGSAKADLLKAARSIEAAGRTQAASAVLGTAVQAGARTPSQVALVEAVFDALKQDRSPIYPALHRGVAGAAAPAAGRLGAAAPTGGPVGGELDLQAINRIRVETAKVSAFLDEVYLEDAAPAAAARTEVAATVSALDGLDAAHAALALSLAARRRWRRTDYEAEARGHGLMPDAASETLNDWSFVRFDEALVEDEGEALVVNGDLLRDGMAA